MTICNFYGILNPLDHFKFFINLVEIQYNIILKNYCICININNMFGNLGNLFGNQKESLILNSIGKDNINSNY